jgi:hypothetical protein
MNTLGGVILPRLRPQVAMAGGAPEPARRMFGKVRCETCATRRSHTNIVVCLLMLGALLSYNWYDVLSRHAAQEPSTVIASIMQDDSGPRPEPAPPPAPSLAVVASEPAPVSEPVRAVVRPVQRRPRSVRSNDTPRPPPEMDGLY